MKRLLGIVIITVAALCMFSGTAFGNSQDGRPTRYKSDGAAVPVSTYSNSLGQAFMLISGGTFNMGSPTDELGRDDNEIQHQVTLTKPFYIQTTEVTQAQWQAVMGNNPSSNSSCANCPVETVSWNDAQDYIAKLNTRGEGTYRLPTEAEWEYAARAGSTTAFANGNITVTGSGCDPILDLIGWYVYNAGAQTHPVGQKVANNWGLYDMHGNVWEWCQDWFGDYPSSAVTDPTGPTSGTARARRSASFQNWSMFCRSAFRSYEYNPGGAYNNTGFRLVRQCEESTHTITATAGTGGTISPSGAVTVNDGLSQTFTITANSGYQISGVLVDGVSQGAIGTYTFANVTGNHTISVSFSLNGATFDFTTIDYPSAKQTVLNAINDVGQIVGDYTNIESGYFYDKAHYPFLFDGVTFGKLEHQEFGIARTFGITNEELMLGGYTDRTSNGYHGFLYDQTTFTKFSYPGAIETAPQDINNSDQIIGYCFLDAGSGSQGFFYDGMSFRQVYYPNASYTSPQGLNDKGHIVGYFSDGSNSHGFLYDGSNYEILDFPGSIWTWCLDVNDKGHIVGIYNDGSSYLHGFFFDGQAYVTIDFPGADSTFPEGINNLDQIVGSYSSGAISHGFIANPTPIGPLPAPTLSVATNGTTVALSWTSVSNATGYTLYYAPYPTATPIGSINMKTQTNVSYALQEGAAFYVAVQAYNSFGNSGYSNIEYFFILYTNSLGQSFVAIQPDTFIMGSPSDELGRSSDEKEHQVTLTEPFYMQTTEVTQAQWEAVMGSNPSFFSGCPTCPVEYVTWTKVQKYIDEMNKLGEGTYSLPTEAQWEYAARAGSTTAFYNGEITELELGYDPNLDAIAWYTYNSEVQTHPVAKKDPNAWGLYDMSGNVWEYCQDSYWDYPDGPVVDPLRPPGSRILKRGGGYPSYARDCRSAVRAWAGTLTWNSWSGFRLVRQRW